MEQREIVATAYAAGLLTKGITVDTGDTQYGLEGGLLVRSAFSALPLDRPHEPLTDELTE